MSVVGAPQNGDAIFIAFGESGFGRRIGKELSANFTESRETLAVHSKGSSGVSLFKPGRYTQSVECDNIYIDDDGHYLFDSGREILKDAIRDGTTVTLSRMEPQGGPYGWSQLWVSADAFVVSAEENAPQDEVVTIKAVFELKTGVWA